METKNKNKMKALTLYVYFAILALTVVLCLSACNGSRYVYECNGHEVERYTVKQYSKLNK